MSGTASPAGSGVLAALKQKMQNLRDELDKYKDLYEDKCREFEAEHDRRCEVGSSLHCDVCSRWANLSVSHTYLKGKLPRILIDRT
jgi:hypothetical protein